MLKYLAHDTVNDIDIIQTSLWYNVRYGLEVTGFNTLAAAITKFGQCQRHALAAKLYGE